MGDKIQHHHSIWWYLLPLVFGIIGGIIGFFIIRKDNPQKAKKVLIVGIIVLAVELSFQLYRIFLVLPPLSFMG